MSMIVGGATVALVESKHGGMNCEAYPSRLAMVLAVIDNGGISLADSYYGSAGHKAALDAVEQKIAEARQRIARQDERDAMSEKPAPCQQCGAMTEQEADYKCKRPGDCHGSVLWPEN